MPYTLTYKRSLPLDCHPYHIDANTFFISNEARLKEFLDSKPENLATIRKIEIRNTGWLLNRESNKHLFYRLVLTLPQCTKLVIMTLSGELLDFNDNCLLLIGKVIPQLNEVDIKLMLKEYNMSNIGDRIRNKTYVKNIGNFLAQSEATQSLDLSWSNFPSDDFSLGDLADVLSKENRMQSLNLAGCRLNEYLDDKYFQFFCNILSQLKFVKKIDFSTIRLELPNRLEMLCDALAKTELQSIDLGSIFSHSSGNEPLKDNDFKRLCKELKKLKMTSDIKIERKLTPQQTEKLEKIKKQHRSHYYFERIKTTSIALCRKGLDDQCALKILTFAFPDRFSCTYYQDLHRIKPVYNSVSKIFKARV